MKLVVSILPASVAGQVADALIAAGFGVTRANTHGGFLRRGNVTLLVGVENELLESAIGVMRAAHGHRSAVADRAGGPLFVVDVDARFQL